MFYLSYAPIILYILIEFLRRTPIKEEKQNRGSSVVIGAVLTWMILVPTVIHFLVHVWRIPTVSLYLGVLLGILGVWMRSSSITMLGRFYSRNVGIQHEHELIQTGWYRYIRHPGYFGTLLTYLGFAIATGCWLSVAINVALFLIAYSFRIKVEEAALTSQFGETYILYTKRTWRLIPFIY